MFKAMLWRGQVLWGMMVYDGLRALDFLVTRPDVDPPAHRHAGHVDGQHDGVVAGRARRAHQGHRRHQLPDGLSGAARRERHWRCTACITSCPDLIKHFTTAQINALIAPRAHLGLAGLRDKLTPVEGLDVIDRELKQVYAQARPPGAVEASAIRRRAPGDARGPPGDHRVLEGVSVMRGRICVDRNRRRSVHARARRADAGAGASRRGAGRAAAQHRQPLPARTRFAAARRASRRERCAARSRCRARPTRARSTPTGSTCPRNTTRQCRRA